MVPWTSSTSLQINTFYKIDTGLDNKPKPEAFFPAFMKIPNYSTIDMAIHAAVYLAKALQPPRSESPFQVGGAQHKAIRGLSQIFDAETKIQNRDALPPPPRLANE